MKSIIKAEHISKSYTSKIKKPGVLGSISSFFSNKSKTINAVTDVSFEINEGEMVGFIGANGAGKTTTLKMLSGLVLPSEGNISVLGSTPFKREHAFLKQISLVMGQKSQLWWDLPAVETFQLNKDIYDISDKDYNLILDELVSMLDLSEVMHVPVRKLSLGQRMKCELTAALLHKPQVLFLDEPTIGLDVIMQKNMREFIKRYNSQFNTTVMLTSHYMEDVQNVCNRVIIIGKGSLVFDGSLQKLISDNANYKLVKIIFEQKPKDIEFASKIGEVLSFDGWELVVKVPRQGVAEIAAKLHETYKIDDMDIMEPQLEEIVSKLM